MVFLVQLTPSRSNLFQYYRTVLFLLLQMPYPCSRRPLGTAPPPPQASLLSAQVQLGLSSFLFRATNGEGHREGGLLERLRGVRRWSVSVTSEETRPSSPLSSSSGPYDQVCAGLEAKAEHSALIGWSCDQPTVIAFAIETVDCFLFACREQNASFLSVVLLFLYLTWRRKHFARDLMLFYWIVLKAGIRHRLWEFMNRPCALILKTITSYQNLRRKIYKFFSNCQKIGVIFRP